MYEARVIKRTQPFLESKKNSWNYTEVGVFANDQKGGETLITTYTRNYGDIGPFVYFELRGKEYALYSPLYNVTAVMELPSGKEIARDDSNHDACPVEFWTLWDKVSKEKFDKYPGALVKIVYWACTGHSLEYIDLSRLEEGIITRKSDAFPDIEFKGGVESYANWGHCEQREFSIDDAVQWFDLDDKGRLAFVFRCTIFCEVKKNDKEQSDNKTVNKSL